MLLVRASSTICECPRGRICNILVIVLSLLLRGHIALNLITYCGIAKRKQMNFACWVKPKELGLI